MLQQIFGSEYRSDVLQRGQASDEETYDSELNLEHGEHIKKNWNGGLLLTQM